MWFFLKQIVCCTQLVSLQIASAGNRSATGQYKQAADRDFVSSVFGRSQSFQMFASLFVWYSALHYYCWGCRPTEVGEINAGSGSQRFCVHTYYGGSKHSQMVAYLLLWLSVLCFSFTNPGWRELRKREERSGRLAGVVWSWARLFQQTNWQVGQQQLPDPAPCCYML
jgi:hypothetical protein